MILPITLHLTSVVFGGDYILGTWALWWTKKALLSSNLVFFTEYLYWPIGSSLVYHTLSPLNGLLSIPFQLLFKEPMSLVLSFNLFLWLSFILSGFGVYKLTDYLIKNKKAAFVAGLIFTLMPFRFAHVTRIEVIVMQWVPFFMLYALKLFREKENLVKNSLLVGLFFIMNFYTNMMYAVLMAMFFAICLVYYIIYDKKLILQKDFYKKLIIIGLFSLVLLSPYLYSSKVSSNYLNFIQPVYTESVKYSNDLAGFVIPSEYQSFYGKYFKDLKVNTKYRAIGNGREVFLGFVAIILFIFALLDYKRLDLNEKSMFLFWVIVFVVFVLLSLGPELVVYANVLKIKLHYYFLYTILPFLKYFRTPGRFIVPGLVAFSVIIGYGLRRIFKTYDSKYFLIILVALIMIDYSTVIMKGSYLANDGMYLEQGTLSVYSEIAKDQRKVGLLNHPLNVGIPNPAGWSQQRDYTFYQTIHNKPIVAGFVSREAVENKVYDQYQYMLSYQDPYRALRNNKIGYVVIHKYYLPEDYVNLIKTSPHNYSYFFEDDKLLVYKIE